MNIVWKKPAQRFLRKIEPKDSERIVKKVNYEIANNIRKYLEFLKGKNYYKIRVGNYRLFVDYFEKEGKLVINTINHRRNPIRNNFTLISKFLS